MQPRDPTLRSSRLVLRRWRPGDRAAYAALNADPVVMDHFPAPLTRAESDALVDRIEDVFSERGFGLWAVEVVDDPDEPGGVPFIGHVGLLPAPFLGPEVVEVGWRLDRRWWGRGYASEAAAEALRFGFDELGLDEIVSFTVPANTSSVKVMERIGLRRRPERDFDHPKVDPVAHPHLVHHVVYAATAEEWRATIPPASTR